MRQFRSRVMQQGDRNALATIVRAMNDIFKDMLYNGLAIYINDLIIYTKTYEKHVALLRKVLQCLVDNKFWLKESKCQFFTKRARILGHVITPEGLQADPAKITKIINKPAPKNRKELRLFIGLINYLAKFLLKLTTILAPLPELQGETAVWR